MAIKRSPGCSCCVQTFQCNPSFTPDYLESFLYSSGLTQDNIGTGSGESWANVSGDDWETFEDPLFGRGKALQVGIGTGTGDGVIDLTLPEQCGSDLSMIVHLPQIVSNGNELTISAKGPNENDFTQLGFYESPELNTAVSFTIPEGGRPRNSDSFCTGIHQTRLES